jgi:hypothetical protein
MPGYQANHPLLLASPDGLTREECKREMNLAEHLGKESIKV